MDEYFVEKLILPLRTCFLKKKEKLVFRELVILRKLSLTVEFLNHFLNWRIQKCPKALRFENLKFK